MNRQTLKEYALITVGTVIFAASINLFLVPCNLYNGGIVGTSQIIRTILIKYFDFKASYDIAGIINLCINIPLLVIAYRKLSPAFVRKTIYSVLIQTIVFSIIPIMDKRLISDWTALVLIGTFLSAFGAGLILIQRATAGGNDVTGMLVSKKYPKFSIGNFNISYNVALYLVCAVVMNVETAICSIFQQALYSYVFDKMHLQNIEVSVMIFTKNPEVKKAILTDQKRGVTYWEGAGAYTNTKTEVLVTIVSKYEVKALRKRIKNLDNKAFIIVSSQMDIDGGYEKRLI